MRILALCVILLSIGYLYLGDLKNSLFADRQFRMSELEVAPRVGRLTETNRDDLFVAYNGNPEYSVPESIVSAATAHQTGTRRWHSYRPEVKHGSYPVIMLFHGAGRSGLSMVDMWRDTADRHGLFLIALDGEGQNWSTQNISPSILHNILSEANEVAPINLDQVYLFGHSRGAQYVQTLLNQAEGPWRAAAVHGGFSDPAAAIIPVNAKPIRFYLGTRDHIFHSDSARSVAQALTAKGHDVDLHFIPNHTHWFYEVGPVIAADAWHWFAQQ